MQTEVQRFTDDILLFYTARLQELSVSKRFHFLSRLHLWSGKKLYGDELASLKADWFDQEKYFERARMVSSIMPQERLRGRAYRRSASLRYYKIFPYNRIFFRALFLDTIFGDTASQELVDVLDRGDLELLYQNLLSDTEAVATLSTPAVNFLCHYGRVRGRRVPADFFLEVGKVPLSTLSTHDAREALLYMYTHAVIGASLFYASRPPEEDMSVYEEMMRNAEVLITEHFDSISLDIKCEFLVCAKMLGYTTPLFEKIGNEVLDSKSALGTYIVDVHNENRRKTFDTSFQRSEHRNVLAIMAFSSTEHTP